MCLHTVIVIIKAAQRNTVKCKTFGSKSILILRLGDLTGLSTLVKQNRINPENVWCLNDSIPR